MNHLALFTLYSMSHTLCKFSLASLAEKIESNLFGKLNRRQNFQCAGMFAYFCCCPELLCFMTLLLREELKGIFYFERLLGCENFHQFKSSQVQSGRS